MAQLGARLDGIEEVVGSNPIGSTKFLQVHFLRPPKRKQRPILRRSNATPDYRANLKFSSSAAW